MILSIEFQAELFRDMFLIGVICGFVYDLIRLLRANIKHSRWIMCIEDVFYWAGVIMSAYMFMLSENSGQVRIFVMLAFFGGMLLYGAVISRYVFNTMLFMTDKIKKAVKLIIKITFYPANLLAGAIWHIIGKPVLKTGNILKIRVKKLFHLGFVYAKMSKRSLKRQFGFIKRSNKKRGTEYGKRKKEK